MLIEASQASAHDAREQSADDSKVDQDDKKQCDKL
jgi:hypothetical protein